MADYKLFKGDCLELMKDVPDGSIDMVLCDPPYSSGGLYRSDRIVDTRNKYTDNGFTGASRFPSFSGDNMDQRSFTEFMRMVLAKCRQKSKKGSVAMVFVDWRQLPAMVDAIQMGGYIYRGIVVWDKGTSRPIQNRFRNDCEYVVWGTNGQRKTDAGKGCFIGAGCFHIPSVPSVKKNHQTEKPVELLAKLIEITPKDGVVFDCFMGSGSTGVAAMLTGRNFIGMELDDTYFATAERRIAEAKEKADAALFAPE